jgi:hypothetical protein
LVAGIAEQVYALLCVKSQHLPLTTWRGFGQMPPSGGGGVHSPRSWPTVVQPPVGAQMQDIPTHIFSWPAVQLPSVIGDRLTHVPPGTSSSYPEGQTQALSRKILPPVQSTTTLGPQVPDLES